jgi:hypothetical protein
MELCYNLAYGDDMFFTLALTIFLAMLPLIIIMLVQRINGDIL